MPILAIGRILQLSELRSLHTLTDIAVRNGCRVASSGTIVMLIQVSHSADPHHAVSYCALSQSAVAILFLSFHEDVEGVKACMQARSLPFASTQRASSCSMLHFKLLRAQQLRRTSSHAPYVRVTGSVQGHKVLQKTRRTTVTWLCQLANLNSKLDVVA